MSESEKKKTNIFLRIVKFFIPWKGDSVGNVIRKIIFDGALAVFIITAIPLITDVVTMYKDDAVIHQAADLYISNDEYEEPQTIVNNDGTKTPVPLSSFKELIGVNSDTVGYIRIGDTNVNGPVVQSADNDYYLNHDFYGNENRSGCYMLDFRNDVTPGSESDNYIIYGHNMAVGTFFASLSEYWRTMHDTNSQSSASMKHYKENPTITFDTIYEKSEWKIFAIDLFNVQKQYGEVYDYIGVQKFGSREEFNGYIIDIMDRSDIFTDVDIQYGDQILTLSTCYWPYRSNMENVRLAIFARKVREGESSKVNVEAAKKNPLPVRWQWVYENVGGDDSSKGTWDRRKLLSYTKEDAEKDGYKFLTD